MISSAGIFTAKTKNTLFLVEPDSDKNTLKPNIILYNTFKGFYMLIKA